MGEVSKIQWTDATWNPWHGCKKVSEGCKFCYMYRDKERYGQDPTTVLRSKSNFDAPLKWSLRMQNIDPSMGYPTESCFPGMKIFTCSWSDFFIEEADTWRAEAWEIIKNTPEFTYQILTKRPERIFRCLPDDWGKGYPNVWLGVSVENSKRAVERLPMLSRVPAVVRFVSYEPLIERIDLPVLFWEENAPIGNDWHEIWTYDWAIIGGESGNDNGKYKFRPCQMEWIDYLVQEHKTCDIPVFVKQLGTHLAKEHNLKDRHGGDISEFPEYLRLRQFPEYHNVQP